VLPSGKHYKTGRALVTMRPPAGSDLQESTTLAKKRAGKTRPWSNFSPPAVATGSTGCALPAVLLGSVVGRKVMLAAPRQTPS
jgi:hypothetical protein